VSLSPQLSQSAKPDDTVFVFARAAQGPGIPLAVQRVRVGELPYRFRLDDSMAIMPDRKISGAGQLVVGARVSKSGGANRSSGDLEGFSAAVESGARDVRVVIDQRVP
jgi:cytochrome c-type biogenesis protein CcmH